MAKKEISFPPIFIKHKGYFILSRLLHDVRAWFDNNHYEFHAPKHKHKASEEELGLFGVRKVTGYIMFKISVDMRVWEFREVDVVQEGKTVKKNYGRVALTVSPGYALDYEKRFGGSGWLQALQDFYHRYVIKRRIEDYWEDELFMQAGGLVRVIKTGLEYEAM